MSVALANVGLLFTLIFWLLGCVWGSSLRDARQALSNRVAPPALALFAWVVVAALWSPADGGQIAGAVQKYSKFLMLPIFIGLLHDAATRRRCWQGFALAMLITLVVTWLNVWFDFSWTRTHNQGFGRDHTVFKDYIAQGIMMSFFSCICAYLALKSRTRWGTIAWGSASALAAISILFLSSGRTGYLAWFLSIFVFGLLVTMARSRTALVTTVSGALIVLAVAGGTSLALQERMTQAWNEVASTSGEVTSVGSRMAMIGFSLEQAQERPLLGHGTAAYPVLAKTHFVDPDWCSVVCVHPHNQFAFFLVEQGLIGLTLFAWFLLAIARQGWREEARRRALMLAFLTILVVSNMTHSSFWLSTENHFFILMTALLMAAARHREKS
ncbi:O-antigen ligase family protein [Hydrogenophaga sp.]